MRVHVSGSASVTDLSHLRCVDCFVYMCVCGCGCGCGCGCFRNVRSHCTHAWQHASDHESQADNVGGLLLTRFGSNSLRVFSDHAVAFFSVLLVKECRAEGRDKGVRKITRVRAHIRTHERITALFSRLIEKEWYKLIKPDELARGNAST